MTALVEVVALDVDMDAEVMCAAEECPHVAAWIFDNLACDHGRGIPMCDPHKRAVDALGFLGSLFGGHYVCAVCKTRTVIRWREL